MWLTDFEQHQLCVGTPFSGFGGEGSDEKSASFTIDQQQMSRMESGKVELESKPFSIYRLCHDIVDTVRPLAENKRIEVRFSCARSIAPLRGDAARIGMAVEEQQKFFQPYVQANAATQRQFGGTGLGLVITKQIVQLMGGTVRIDPTRTAVGVGTTMIVELKLPTMYTPSRCNLIDGALSQIRSVASLTPIAQNRLLRRSGMSTGLPGALSRINGGHHGVPGFVVTGCNSMPPVNPNNHPGLFPYPSHVPTPRTPTRLQPYEAIYAPPHASSLIVSPSAIPPIPPPPIPPIPPISFSTTSLSKWKQVRIHETLGAGMECTSTPSTSEQSGVASAVDPTATPSPSGEAIPAFTGVSLEPPIAVETPAIKIGTEERADDGAETGNGGGQVIVGGRVFPLEALFRSLRVLLVEDNMLSGTLMSRILKSMGFGSVEHVLGAEAALDHLASGRNIHIIITDLHLAGSMDGRELASTVRSQLRYRSFSMFLEKANTADTPSDSDSDFEKSGADLFPGNEAGDGYGASTESDLSVSESGNNSPTTTSALLASRCNQSIVRYSTSSVPRTSRRPTTAARELPLILGLSGDANDGTPASCLEAGMNGFLVKPITRDRLSATLASLLVEQSPSQADLPVPLLAENENNKSTHSTIPHFSPFPNDHMIITLTA